MAFVWKDTSTSKTYSYVGLVSNNGWVNWNRGFEIGPDTLSTYHLTQRMMSFSGGSKLAMLTTDPNANSQAYLTIWEGLDTSDHTVMPSTMNNYKIFLSTGQYKFMKMIPHASNGDKFYALVCASGGGNCWLLNIDLQNGEYRKSVFSISSGSSFHIKDLSVNAQGSAADDFFYAGKMSSATDGTLSKTFSQVEGFI